MLSSTSIYVTWSPPSKEGQNGKIRGYKVSYVSEEDYHERQPTTTTTTNQYYTIDNARKYTNYTITVLAFTVIGDGMKTKNFHCITHEDGECFFVSRLVVYVDFDGEKKYQLKFSVPKAFLCMFCNTIFFYNHCNEKFS